MACAMAVRNPTVLAVMLGEAAKQVPAEMIEASRSAAAIMGMNNVYYRFLHLVGNEKYSTIPARLRMNVLRTHGVNPAEFELWCMAVSAVNNCEACVRSHERVLREKGVPEETILAAVRLGALIHAVAMVM